MYHDDEEFQLACIYYGNRNVHTWIKIQWCSSSSIAQRESRVRDFEIPDTMSDMEGIFDRSLDLFIILILTNLSDSKLVILRIY